MLHLTWKSVRQKCSFVFVTAVTKRPIGRPKTRWEDDVLEDIKSMNVRNWKKVIQNRDSWKKVVEQARILYRL